jgi:proteasome lid subunit RPN8/RPN11
MSKRSTRRSQPGVEFVHSVLQQIRDHAQRSMNAEVCGILIGAVRNGVTHVQACIAAENAAQAGAHVTFTHESWEHIYKVKDAQFADSLIVGWYHSHPGFGIFLSDYDLFIHRNFFNGRHQIAWVVDPHSNDEGCFGWIGEDVSRLKNFSIPDQPPVVLGAERPANAKPNRNGPSERSVESVRFLTPRSVTLIALALILLFTAAFLHWRSRNLSTGATPNTQVPAKQGSKKQGDSPRPLKPKR